MQTQKSGKNIQSVQRAIDIINCFKDSNTSLSLGQISAKLGLNKSTVHGILSTLYQNDFIQQSPDGHYMLGSYFARRFGMGDTVIREQLKEKSSEGMTRIANRYGVSCGIFMLELGELVLVNRAQPQSETYMITTHATYIQPLYCSASGKILLANMSEEALEKYLEANPLTPRTVKTISTRKGLMEALEAIRQEGYGIENEELGLGVYALSVPIYDNSDKLFATVGATGLALRMRMQKEAIVKDLKELSREISQQLF